jgi:hypothetical protein
MDEKIDEREFREFIVRRLFSIESRLLYLSQDALPFPQSKPAQASTWRRFVRKLLPKRIRVALVKLRNTIQAI